MVDHSAFKILKQIPEYKEFRRNAKIRSAGVGLFLGVFWIVALQSLNLDVEIGALICMFGVLSIATLLLVPRIIQAFFREPKIVIFGRIQDMRKRVVYRSVGSGSNSRRRRRKRIIKQEYLITFCNDSFWGESVSSYNNKPRKEYQIGDEVIFFSLLGNYIIKMPGNNIEKM